MDVSTAFAGGDGGSEFYMDIVLIGKSNSHNNLLCNYLEKQFNCRCRCLPVEDIDSFNAPDSGNDLITLIDSNKKNPDELVFILDALSKQKKSIKIAFINVQSSMQCEKLLLWPNVRGIFLDEADEENISKGIDQVMNGEYWISRNVMARFMEHLHSTMDVAYVPSGQLTKRESHILKLICDGNSNNEIARVLNLSLSTVKTHAHNLFKKLNVSNRVQAANLFRNITVSGH